MSAGRVCLFVLACAASAAAHWGIDALEGTTESLRLAIARVGLVAVAGCFLAAALLYPHMKTAVMAWAERGGPGGGADTDPRPLLRERALLAGFALVLAGLTAAVFADRSLGIRLAVEDGPVEIVTALLYAAAALSTAVLARRRRGRVRFVLAILALLFVVVSLEEMSWGQRLLGYGTPDAMREWNVQQEFNFHNLWSTSVTQYAGLAFTGGVLLLIPIIATSDVARRTFAFAGVPVPPLRYAAAYLAAVAAFLVIGARFGTMGVGPFSRYGLPANLDDEYLEFFLAYLFFTLSVCSWKLSDR